MGQYKDVPAFLVSMLKFQGCKQIPPPLNTESLPLPHLSTFGAPDIFAWHKQLGRFGGDFCGNKKRDQEKRGGEINKKTGPPYCWCSKDVCFLFVSFLLLPIDFVWQKWRWPTP